LTTLKLTNNKSITDDAINALSCLVSLI
jgi:hypothetical protein